ncbi:MAG TPA: phosphate/phosphite/phosphonate ABC transporter substrate-binding protein [Candidatus Ozemobacteraceae bacterium]|nr:phosphate/phosphite/phosphonate ABC transporter substrate-binding protein [Candidatus Ozemobacteraceae bacterium]
MKMFRSSGTCLLFALLLVFSVNVGFAESQDFPPVRSDDPYANTNYQGYTDEDDSWYQTDDEASSPGSPETEPPQPPPPPPVVPQPPIQLDQKSVLIGRPPYLSLSEMMHHVSTLFAFLKKEMGVKEVRLVTGQDYTSVLAALIRGKIDFAWVGPMAYVIANEKGDLMPIAKARHPGGTAYRGVFITLNNGRVLGLDDIRGKTVGFVDPESASGYLYPLYLLKRLKIDPHKACKVLFLKRHDAILGAVLDGKIDVGVCLEATLKTIGDPKQLNRILVLGKTDEVPSDVLVCRKDCPVNLRERFLEALLKCTASGAAEPLRQTFAPAKDADFQSVQDVWNAVRPMIPRP